MQPAEPDSRNQELGIPRSLVERIEVHPAEAGFEIGLIDEIAARYCQSKLA